MYHKGPTIDKKSFNYTISTINKGTTLNINNEAYNLTLAADARYVLTPVSVIYRMLKDAKAKPVPPDAEPQTPPQIAAVTATNARGAISMLCKPLIR